jgi:cyclopropane fatty-acyl-phospholipid synthase-like methyltransferase
MTVKLPYWDDLFARLAQGPDSITRGLGVHTHWGFFTDPQATGITDEAYIAAAQAMTERVCRSAQMENGQRILEVGCGLGGTLSYNNDRLTHCELVGLNIDPRQIEHARKRVTARPTNTVTFVVGDACALPFDERSFDRVLAVECIFHFPSRRGFLSEARRVLAPGGRLTISDFIVDSNKFDEMTDWMEANPTAQGSFFGSMTPAISSSSYERLGRTKGLKLVMDEDISAETMPTYEWLERAYAGHAEAVKTAKFLEDLARLGFFQYRILSFEATT